MISSTRAAKWCMKLIETYPDPHDPFLSEIFNHPDFTEGSEDHKREVMHASSECRYQYEQEHPFDRLFSIELKPLLAGKRVLDLGCFTGGRTVAWAQRYEPREMHGIDVSQIFVQAAQDCANGHEVDAHFQVAVGENLPYDDEYFDDVLTFDVLEHVSDVGQTMSEVWRVLRPAGHLIAAFPQYLNPIEHHCGMVTITPCIHWLFSADTIRRAFTEIVEERGDEADWYRREFFPWEKLYSINGTSVAGFKEIVQSQGWTTVYERYMVCLSTIRPVSRRRILRTLIRSLSPLLAVPRLREYLADRVTVVLQKPHERREAR